MYVMLPGHLLIICIEQMGPVSGFCCFTCTASDAAFQTSLSAGILHDAPVAANLTD